MFQGKLFTYRFAFSLRNSFTLFIGILFFTLMIGCEEKAEDPNGSMDFSQKLTCEGCHTDEVTLQKLAPGYDPQPPSTGGG
ncbi:MAG: hypothetical protein P8Y60_04400 [Calditrichota bacterium]|jgi:hypothetical protein